MPVMERKNASVRLLLPEMMCLGLVGRRKVVVQSARDSESLVCSRAALSLHLAEEAVEIELFFVLLLVPEIA